MIQKSKRVVELMGKVDPGYDLPAPDRAASLLEFGLLCVLSRSLSRNQGATTLKQIHAAYPDWNEVRVCQVQEILPHVATKDRALGLRVAADVKTYLQEVFQKNHGFDLEFLREDLGGAGKFVVQLEFLGAAAAHDLLWQAAGADLPVTGGLIRVLDRLGLIARTSSLRKARTSIEPLVPEGKAREFAVHFARVVEHWCDARKPLCHECPLLDFCPHGAKVYKDWQAQQKRLEAQRERDEARQAALAKKEEARRKREEERERKRQEADQRRRDREKARAERERDRKRRELEKHRAREEAARKRAEQKKKDEARKKAAAKKKAEAKKKADAKKKAAAKKAAAKKKASKKSASRKTTKKKTTRSSGVKKAAKKPARKTTKKTVKKPATRKKPAANKKKTTRKTTKKKTKKTTTRKKTTRRR